MLFHCGICQSICLFNQVFKEKTLVFIAMFVQLTLCIVFITVVSLQMDNLYIIAVILGFFVSHDRCAPAAGFGIVMSSRIGGAGAASGIFGMLNFVSGAITSPLVGLMGDEIYDSYHYYHDSVLHYVNFVFCFHIASMVDSYTSFRINCFCNYRFF